MARCRAVRRLSAAAAVTGSVLLAACGGGAKLDEAELEEALVKQLGDNAGVEPKSVDCPDDITIEKGKKFDCTLTAPNGEKVPVNVTLTNNDGGFNAEVPPQP